MKQHTEMVAMRDGARLATDIHLPNGAGPFPVILERTPYGRHLPSRRRDHCRLTR
jgi:predicted acyl esterase